MRLIDADKLLEPGYTDMFDAPIRFAMVSRNAIETAPTVKAITVEWIEKWKNGKTSIEQVVADKIMMDYKYRDWEKENARD